GPGPADPPPRGSSLPSSPQRPSSAMPCRRSSSPSSPAPRPPCPPRRSSGDAPAGPSAPPPAPRPARHPPPAPPSRSSPGARPGRRACRRSPERPASASSSGPADPRAAARRRRRRAAVCRRRAVRRRRRVPSLAGSVGGGWCVRVCILWPGTYVVTPRPRHPSPTSYGARAMMRFARVLIAASIPLACAAADDRGGADPGAVRPGVEVFVENPPEVVRGKRVGLITNHSGMDRQRRATIDLLRAMPELELVALFSPEHGIRGVAESRVESGVDEATGLPVHSLYSDTRKPTPEMLEGIEALVYDIFDVGVRQYTYESTLALAMQAAAEKGIPIVVLDRPNPVTGRIVEGNILEPGFESFVGIYPVLSRHGMTVGELARMYNVEQGIGADLTVV